MGRRQSNWAEFQSAPDWVAYILGRRLTAEPGAAFNYSTGNTHLLSAALQQAAGKSLLEYGREKLFEPLGMDSVVWRADPQGVTDGGNGISMTARDAARFGQLYLEGGVWNGRRLIPADWLAQSTAAQNNGAGTAPAATATNGGCVPLAKGATTPTTPSAHGGSTSSWCPSSTW